MHQQADIRSKVFYSTAALINVMLKSKKYVLRICSILHTNVTAAKNNTRKLKKNE